MTVREAMEARSEHPGALTAGIFDVDGVPLASPHERVAAVRTGLSAKGFEGPRPAEAD